MNCFNPELQLEDTESAIRNKLIDLLTELKGFKLVTALILEFKKIENDNKTKYSTFHLNSKPETVINESDTNDMFESTYSAIESRKRFGLYN